MEVKRKDRSEKEKDTKIWRGEIKLLKSMLILLLPWKLKHWIEKEKDHQ